MKNVLFILGDLSDGDAEWLAANGQVRRHPRGHVLIRQGEFIDELFMILDGEVEVGILGFGMVAQLGQGEILGEVSFLDARPTTATVTVATAHAAVLAVPRPAIERKLAEDGLFAARFYKAVARFVVHRLRQLNHARAGDGLLTSDEMEGELSPELLSTMHVAAARFRQILERLSGRAA